MPPCPDPPSPRARVARNRHRQRELFGCPLGERVHRVTTTLDVTQRRLARALGVSPAMLSQLASARRVTIGDPAVLARLHLLDQRCAAVAPRGPQAVEELLDEVGRARPQWSGQWTGQGTAAPPPGSAAALRAVAPPARLVAAAATLAPAFPELAELLLQAAQHHGAPSGGGRRHPSQLR